MQITSDQLEAIAKSAGVSSHTIYRRVLGLYVRSKAKRGRIDRELAAHGIDLAKVHAGLVRSGFTPAD